MALLFERETETDRQRDRSRMTHFFIRSNLLDNVNVGEIHLLTNDEHTVSVTV